ncbi:MAG: 50S ribosomal protein L25 [Phycisphaerae bacterium]|nr:50S ribosomal protein L25 [Phycisphaerae bacterium]
MHEDAPVLNATKRERIGSRYARRDREAGRLPAIVYGHKVEPVAVSLDAHATLLLLHKGEKVFQLHLEGGSESEFVLVKDLQYDYLGTNIVHCDLERVDLDERIHIKVPVHFIGESNCKGLKSAGTTLMHPMSELDLECAVTNLPDFLEVDITNLEVGGTIHAKDVQLPKETMRLLSDPDGVVAHIVAHGGSDADGDEAGSVDGQAAPEVLSEKKGDADGDD